MGLLGNPKDFFQMKDSFPILKTERTLLREIDEKDLANVFEGLSHPEVIRYYGISYSSLEATLKQMEWFKEESQMWWAICSPDNRVFYGAAGLNDLDPQEKKAEIGFWLMPQYWGNGIISEVVPKVVDYGLKVLDLDRIEAFVETENTNSKRVMDKLGFRLEKTLWNCELKNEKPISLDVYIKSKSTYKHQIE